MKVIRKDEVLKHDLVESVIEERNVFRLCQHPFLVRMDNAFQNEERLFFVMEYVKGGELWNHLRDQARFEEEQVKFYIAQLVMAVGALHAKNLIHRDIKPENILINDDGYLKLADFGMAK